MDCGPRAPHCIPRAWARGSRCCACRRLRLVCTRADALHTRIRCIRFDRGGRSPKRIGAAWAEATARWQGRPRRSRTGTWCLRSAARCGFTPRGALHRSNMRANANPPQRSRRARGGAASADARPARAAGARLPHGGRPLMSHGAAARGQGGVPAAATAAPPGWRASGARMAVWIRTACDSVARCRNRVFVEIQSS